MKYLSSFAATHAIVIALVIGVFLIDGCAHRLPRTGLKAADAPDASASASLEARGQVLVARKPCP